MTGDHEILVAYDASEDGVAGLSWAVAEAKATGATLRVMFVEYDVTAVDAVTALAWTPVVSLTLTHPGEAITADGVSRAQAAGVAAVAEVGYGPAAAVLADKSRDAVMLVIGSRGVGALREAFLGSTAQHVVAHAHCPVVVVRQGAPDGPVAVGVDGSAESLQTLGWAADFASRHGRALHVLYAYELPIYPEVVPYVAPAEMIEEVVSAADRAVAEEVAGLGAKYPDLIVTTQAVRERAAHALARASETASLVVVGSHGRGGFTGMLLGATSNSLLHHAHCPVAVIRHEKPQ